MDDIVATNVTKNSVRPLYTILVSYFKGYLGLLLAIEVSGVD